MSTGYSATPLPKKLGLKPGMGVVAVNLPPDVRRLLESDLKGVNWLHRSTDVQVAWIFATKLADLRKSLRAIRKRLQPTGFVWVSWPKKTSGVSSDITENRIREIALTMALVDVKVCAVTDVWSGLKLVVRISDR